MNSDSARELLVINLGLIAYDQAHVFQRAAARLRVRGDIAQDLLILCEHTAVVTLGRSSKPENLLATREQLALNGIDVREVERGGDVTIHEPGQLIGYPIVDLKRHKQDLHWYLRQIEQSLMLAMRQIGLVTERQVGQTGVWIGRRKLASIGVHARDWVTSHGFALNAYNGLATFAWVVPCGIADVVMTTVARECDDRGLRCPSPLELREIITGQLASVFTLSARTASHDIVEAIRAELKTV